VAVIWLAPIANWFTLTGSTAVPHAVVMPLQPEKGGAVPRTWLVVASVNDTVPCTLNQGLTGALIAAIRFALPLKMVETSELIEMLGGAGAMVKFTVEEVLGL